MRNSSWLFWVCVSAGIAVASEAQADRCDWDALSPQVASSCGVGAYQLTPELSLPGDVPNSVVGSASLDLVATHRPFQDPRGEHCGPMAVCTDPIGVEQQYRRIVIDSGSMSRDTAIRFEVYDDEIDRMEASGATSVTFARVRFREAVPSSAYRDLELSFSPDPNVSGMLQTTAVIYDSVSGSSSVLSSAKFPGGQSVEISVQSAPQGLHSMKVTLSPFAPGYFPLLLVNNNIPLNPNGTVPAELHYGNLAVDMLSRPSAITQVLELSRWDISVGESFVRSQGRR